MTENKRPKVNSEGQKELDKAEAQFKEFDDHVKSLTMDRMNAAPKQELEPQTKLSQSEIEKSKDIYLKPERIASCRDKFNEKFREDYNYAKEYVQFIAEHKEIIGESIPIWTRPFAGMNAEFWQVPVNKPVYGPRYLAEQIKGCKYHKFSMENTTATVADQMGHYYGAMVVDNVVQRLDAYPVRKHKSIFMGNNEFNSKRAA